MESSDANKFNPPPKYVPVPMAGHTHGHGACCYGAKPSNMAGQHIILLQPLWGMTKGTITCVTRQTAAKRQYRKTAKGVKWGMSNFYVLGHLGPVNLSVGEGTLWQYSIGVPYDEALVEAQSQHHRRKRSRSNHKAGLHTMVSLDCQDCENGIEDYRASQLILQERQQHYERKNNIVRDVGSDHKAGLHTMVRLDCQDCDNVIEDYRVSELTRERQQRDSQVERMCTHHWGEIKQW